MKTIVLLGLSMIGLATAAKIIESPDLLPLEVWDTIPTAGAELTADDLSALNWSFGPVTALERRLTPAWDEWRAAQASIQRSATAVPAVRPILLAQAARAPIAPTPPETPTPPEAPTPPPAPDEDAQPNVHQEVAKELARVKRDAERAQRDAERQLQLSTAAAKEMSNFHFKFATSGAEQRSLVIRTTDADPKSLAAAEEDLNVMARILNRAVAKAGEGEDKKAMGVSLLSFGSAAKNFHIEGYGALFLLNVNFPLSGPPASAAEEKQEQTTNSTWDEAKRELYGPREGAVAGKWSSTHPTAARVAFDPKRVEELKESILEALKNASNIRALKDGESVTVVVTSGEGQGGMVENRLRQAVVVGGGYGGGYGGGGSGGLPGFPEELMEQRSAAEAGRSRSSARAGSTLSIRVKKTDVDGFSKGKMNLEEFRRKATVLLY